MIETRLTAELADLPTAGLTRRRRMLESPCGRIATVDGTNVLNFASNDYLGLAGNTDIAAALADGARQKEQHWAEQHWGQTTISPPP